MKIKLSDLKCKNKKGVYFIENTVTGRIYIGSTPKTSFTSRYRRHRNGLIKGSHDNSKMQRDFETYGGKSFVFYIKEVVDTGILDVELSYLKMFKDSGLLYNRSITSNFPNTPNNKIHDKGRVAIQEGFVYYHKVKNGELLLKDVPRKFKGFVLGKLGHVVWNKGLTKDKFDYKHLRNVPKTKTDKYLKGRRSAKETMRGKSKPVHVFDFNGVYLKTFRSVSDIVDYSRSCAFDVILSSSSLRRYKGDVRKAYVLEANNIHKVLKGGQKHHKGLQFSHSRDFTGSLKPSDIKFNFVSWEQCFFLSCLKEESLSENRVNSEKISTETTLSQV